MTAWGFDTKAIHSGIDPARHQGSTSIPVYATTSFAYDSARDLADVFEGKKFGYIYSRISNPTVAASFSTWMISSIISRFRISGIKPAPMP